MQFIRDVTALIGPLALESVPHSGTDGTVHSIGVKVNICISEFRISLSGVSAQTQKAATAVWQEAVPEENAAMTDSVRIKVSIALRRYN